MAKKTDFEEKKELLEIKLKHDVDQHEMRMIELIFIRETNKLNHNDELTRGRIKTAEIRRAFDRKELANMRRFGK